VTHQGLVRTRQPASSPELFAGVESGHLTGVAEMVRIPSRQLSRLEVYYWVAGRADAGGLLGGEQEAH